MSLCFTLPNGHQLIWDWDPDDASTDIVFDGDPQGFIDTTISQARYNCPLFPRHVNVEDIMSMFATRLWWSNAQQPSSIWVGRDGEKYFVGYTFDEGDFYSQAQQYVQKINI